MSENRHEEEIRLLRNRLARLMEASLRINESLDFDTVLQHVLDSARALIEARYGVIILFDEGGGVRDFLASGMTPEEAQDLWSLPDGLTFFDYLRTVDKPLRLRDFNSHMESMGLPRFSPAFSLGTAFPFLAAPVLYRGEVVGLFYLGEKEGGEEFSDEDEETLVMFASQAAMVIVNARRYLEERRARADLETLIDTSPVGVAVFDARTGNPTSMNRETERLLHKLLSPGQSPESLLEVMTVVRSDGTEISLEEISMPQVLSIGETVRAEEVVLGVPDGRSVTVLINATPIRSEAGEVESFIVTIQDMSPLQEMDLLRAEFLGMVSHELRTPLTSVKGSVTTLLDPAASLNQAETRQFLRIIDTQTDRMRALISDLLDVARIEAGALSVSPEPTDLVALVDEAKTAFMSAGGKHDIQVYISAELPWIMADRQRMAQVLGNLLSNAARHSPETSPIELNAVRDEFNVIVSVYDRGRGIPAENLPNLFRKFSRLDSDDQGGDTGLGLAVCKGVVEAHGGRIWAESDGSGRGSRFTFTVAIVEESGFVSPMAPAARLSGQEVEGGICILAVDDDPQALRFVREALSNAGYQSAGAGDREEALHVMDEQRPDLVLLDVMLPGTNGIEMMKELRETYDVPVIMLSAYGQDELVARAFDSGAADYVVKPFSPTELTARIRAALRREVAAEPATPYVLGDLVIDYAERRVTLAGRPVQMTSIEYRTLAELAVNAGRVLTYAQLLRRVWGTDQNASLSPMRTVISSLRRSLGDGSDNPTYIFTEPRVGYRMARGYDAGMTISEPAP